MDCLFEKELQSLIRKGKPSQKTLNRAWEMLFAEYLELSGNANYSRLFRLSKEIGSLHSKMLAVRIALQVLSFRRSDPSIEILRRFGYRNKFDESNMQSYLSDIESVAKRAKATELEYQQRLNEYNKLLKEGGKESTRKDFERRLVDLSQYMGYRLDPKQITVTEFVAINKKAENESEKWQAKGK